jgi:rhamnosyltransferase
MSILGILVTYNPNINDLIRNINLILPQVNKLIIFDNDSLNKYDLLLLKKDDEFEIIFSNDNIGLGAAYNKIILRNLLNYDYLITFDQDTQVPNNLVSNLLLLFKLQNVGIVGPSFVNKLESKVPFKDVDVLIQSASIFKMNLFSEIGLFNSAYFIDSVDFEFCLRAKLNGYRVLRSNQDFINHNLGVTKKFLNLDISTHNSVRNFYISRNHFDLTIRFCRKFPIFIIKKNIFFIIHIFKVALFQRDLKSLIKIFQGFVITIKSI